MARVYNFSAGPAVLPEEVLKEAAAEMLDYQGSGQSVMEMSHRSKVYDKIIKDAEQDLRDLLNIPDNYKVLFLQGGAHLQFAMVPMNFMKNKKADYIVTGQWAKRAFKEAQKFGDAKCVASSEDKTFSYIPDCSDLPIDDDADYVYICENNTIYGTKFKTLPNTKGKDLVADVDPEIVAKLYRGFHARFRHVKTYNNWVTNAWVRNNGYASNLLGRRYYIEESKDVYKLNNYLIQGSAADIIKLVIIRVDDFLRTNGYKTRLQGCIHDELCICVAEGEHDVIYKIKHIMENTVKTYVPLVAEVSISTTNWAEKHGE